MKTLLALAALALAGCKDKSAPVSGGNAMTKMGAFRDQMCACKDAACAKRVSHDMAEWGKQQSDAKPDALTGTEQKRSNEIGRQIGECMARATGDKPGSPSPLPPPPTPTPVDTAGSGSAAPRPPRNTLGLPVECDDYKDAIAKISTCDAIAASARETLVKGYEDASTRWSTMKDAKATLQTSCSGGLEAVIALGKERCGW